MKKLKKPRGLRSYQQGGARDATQVNLPRRDQTYFDPQSNSVKNYPRPISPGRALSTFNQEVINPGLDFLRNSMFPGKVPMAPKLLEGENARMYLNNQSEVRNGSDFMNQFHKYPSGAKYSYNKEVQNLINSERENKTLIDPETGKLFNEKITPKGVHNSGSTDIPAQKRLEHMMRNVEYGVDPNIKGTSTNTLQKLYDQAPYDAEQGIGPKNAAHPERPFSIWKWQGQPLDKSLYGELPLELSYPEKNQYGGPINDNRGQWTHPGQVTRIQSPNITMKGVNYPVFGKPNNGPGQMMFPNQEYHYPGASHVTEYPMKQRGGVPVDTNALRRFNKDIINEFGVTFKKGYTPPQKYDERGNPILGNPGASIDPHSRELTYYDPMKNAADTAWNLVAEVPHAMQMRDIGLEKFNDRFSDEYKKYNTPEHPSRDHYVPGTIENDAHFGAYRDSIDNRLKQYTNTAPWLLKRSGGSHPSAAKAQEMLTNPPKNQPMTKKQMHYFQALAHGWNPKQMGGGMGEHLSVFPMTMQRGGPVEQDTLTYRTPFEKDMIRKNQDEAGVATAQRKVLNVIQNIPYFPFPFAANGMREMLDKHTPSDSTEAWYRMNEMKNKYGYDSLQKHKDGGSSEDNFPDTNTFPEKKKNDFLEWIQRTSQEAQQEQMMESMGYMKKGGGFHINPAHKGWCTPMSKSTCTGKRRQFAINAKHHFKKQQDGGTARDNTYVAPMYHPPFVPQHGTDEENLKMGLDINNNAIGSLFNLPPERVGERYTQLYGKSPTALDMNTLYHRWDKAQDWVNSMGIHSKHQYGGQGYRFDDEIGSQDVFGSPDYSMNFHTDPQRPYTPWHDYIPNTGTRNFYDVKNNPNTGLISKNSTFNGVSNQRYGVFNTKQPGFLGNKINQADISIHNPVTPFDPNKVPSATAREEQPAWMDPTGVNSRNQTPEGWHPPMQAPSNDVGSDMNIKIGRKNWKDRWWATPEVLNTGMGLATNIIDNLPGGAQDRLKKWNKMTRTADWMNPATQGGRGDYETNQGYFRPDQQTPVQYYQEGGEYDMSDDQIRDFLQNGGEVEIID